MRNRQKLIFSIGFTLFSLAGYASSPTFVNDNETFSNAEKNTRLNAVHFKIEKKFITSPPLCIAIQ
ncbi:MAG: hypothetical protein HRT92_07945 [Piscirickettsiaceae bacterium]|nr:hypothetical protein [Piscirickettsiaceae bacterium]